MCYQCCPVLGLCYQCQRAPATRATNSKVQSLRMVMGCSNPRAGLMLCKGSARGERCYPQRGVSQVEAPLLLWEHCGSSQSLCIPTLLLPPKCCCSCRAEKFFCYHLAFTWSFFSVLSLQSVYHRGVFPRGRLTAHPGSFSCDFRLIYLSKFSLPLKTHKPFHCPFHRHRS